MSNYPKWWDQTITVYNRYEDPTTRYVSWQSTVLTDCFWKHAGEKVAVGNTIIETDTIICRIPKNPLFVEKYIWDNMTAGERAEYFTVGTGDIIVRGEVSDVVDEYTSGSRSSDLMTKYRDLQGCMKVDKCTIAVGTGRGMEHYYVRGYVKGA